MMTFQDFEREVRAALEKKYGALRTNVTFHDRQRWEFDLVLDGKPHELFAFDYGRPPLKDEKARFSRKLADYLSRLPA